MSASPIDVLRRAAWKGRKNGIGRAIEDLGAADLFRPLADAWDELQGAYAVWHEDRNAENTEVLEQALSDFDDACEPLLGKTEWELAIAKGEQL